MDRYRRIEGYFTCRGDVRAFAPWVELAGKRYRCSNKRGAVVPPDFPLHRTSEAAEQAAPPNHNLLVAGQLETIGARTTLHFGPEYRAITPKRRIVTP